MEQQPTSKKCKFCRKPLRTLRCGDAYGKWKLHDKCYTHVHWSIDLYKACLKDPTIDNIIDIPRWERKLKYYKAFLK